MRCPARSPPAAFADVGPDSVGPPLRSPRARGHATPLSRHGDAIGEWLILSPALAGDRAGAERAFTEYLALRFNPEPVVAEEVRQVRAALARIVGDRRRAVEPLAR